MPKSDYIKDKGDLFSAQLQTFKTNFPAYAAVLDLGPTEINAQAADADYFAYMLACQRSTQNAAQQWTAWKRLMRAGGAVPGSGAPQPLVFPAAVPAVAPGIEGRFRSLGKQIKAHPSYNVAMGEALGLEGPLHAGPDLTTVKPVITTVVSGNAVFIGWGWQRHRAALDLLEIHVNRGDGQGWVMLIFDTTPGYTDTTPFPAAPVKWQYRAIYRVDDARVGQWSNDVEIIVGG